MDSDNVTRMDGGRIQAGAVTGPLDVPCMHGSKHKGRSGVRMDYGDVTCGVTIGSMESKRKFYLAVDIAVLEECGSRKFGYNPNLKSMDKRCKMD